MSDEPNMIGPGEAPGGLVFVHYVDGHQELVQPLPRAKLVTGIATATAEYAADHVNRWIAEGRTVVMVVYDGDTGAALLSMPVSLMRRLREFFSG